MATFEPSDLQFRERVQASFAKQTFMATLGATLARVEPGEVDLELAHHPSLVQQHGFLHAGAIASVLDSACGYAALSLMPDDAGVLSIEFKVNLMEPARGERFVARGRVLRAGRTIFVCRADAVAQEHGRETVVATMQATMMCLVERGVRG